MEIQAFQQYQPVFAGAQYAELVQLNLEKKRYALKQDIPNP